MFQVRTKSQIQPRQGLVLDFEPEVEVRHLGGKRSVYLLNVPIRQEGWHVRMLRVIEECRVNLLDQTGKRGIVVRSGNRTREIPTISGVVSRVHADTVIRNPKHPARDERCLAVGRVSYAEHQAVQVDSDG